MQLFMHILYVVINLEWSICEVHLYINSPHSPHFLGHWWRKCAYLHHDASFVGQIASSGLQSSTNIKREKWAYGRTPNFSSVLAMAAQRGG